MIKTDLIHPEPSIVSAEERSLYQTPYQKQKMKYTLSRIHII